MTTEIDPDLVKRVQATFAALPSGSFPAPVSLTTYLTENAPPGTPLADVPVAPKIAGMFMTASVEMWHRAVHSFLYSAALTDFSPVWSAVSGYYASHYSVRAIAHLLGHFQLFAIKRNVALSLQHGAHVCQYTKKKGGQGDHRFYWKKVKQCPYFALDALFTSNIETDRVSDSAHRGRANYGDHLNQFRPFGVPTREELITRVQYISNIVFTAPPIPDRDEYPDVESVQVVAYHRIVRYRRFLDEILGAQSNFWTRHRTPQWCDTIVDFQLVEQDGLAQYDQMKYMGSKRVMLQNGLGELLSAQVKGKKRIVDLFCGSASVAWFTAQRFPVPVLATDLQQYSVILANAVLERTECLPVTRTLNEWKTRSREWRQGKAVWEEAVELDEAAINTRTWAKRARELCVCRRPKNAPLWNAYGGYYFSPSQALIFDSLLATMPTGRPKRTACHAAVIIAASKCVAAPGHTAQPFKATTTAGPYLREAWMRDPFHYLQRAVETVFSLSALSLGCGRVADANNEAQSVTEDDLVFIDPPYSGVQYSRFYHVLETIAVGNCGKVSGTGRYPPTTERPGSRYSRVSQSQVAFDDLIAKLAEKGATAIVTFPSSSCSNGISGEIVEEICSRYFHTYKRSVTTHFSTMGGNNTHRSSRKPTEELILLLKP